MPVHFCTFGNTETYSGSTQLLQKEANLSGYFDTVSVYNQFNIPNQHTKFINENSRGYGYWIWKPLVILDMFSKKPLNDIIVYADGGCGISTSINARENFLNWIKIVDEHPTHRLGFVMEEHKEEMWTKMDLFDIMDCNDDKYKLTGQYAATVQVYKNTENNINFIKEQLRIMILDNYHYLTDDKSYIPNSITFKDHRHDQSVLSLLYKKFGCATQVNNWNDYSYPILTLRRKF